MAKPLSHFDTQGNAHMVDVGGKSETAREARAAGRIRMHQETIKLIVQGTNAKGDVLGIARVAAIQAAKYTSTLIPLCHPLALTRVAVDFHIDPEASRVDIQVSVSNKGRTGVEMEALTAVSVGLLTIYDMCKAADKTMVISDIRLIEKSGGRSGHFRNPESN